MGLAVFSVRRKGGLERGVLLHACRCLTIANMTIAPAASVAGAIIFYAAGSANGLPTVSLESIVAGIATALKRVSTK